MKLEVREALPGCKNRRTGGVSINRHSPRGRVRMVAGTGVLQLLAVATSSSTATGQDCNVEGGKDYHDAALGMWPSTTFDECKELCAANAEDDANTPCLGIVHVTASNDCHLKKEWGNAAVTSNALEWGSSLRMTSECRAEIMAQADTCLGGSCRDDITAQSNECLSEQNTDHGGGGDMPLWPDTPYEDCKKVCAANSICVGFAHDTRDNKQNCWQKSTWNPPDPLAPDVVSLEMTSSCRAEELTNAGACLVEPNTDHGGGDLGLWANTSIEDCKELCATNSICVGFAHDTRSGKQNCHLKSTWNGPSPLVGLVSLAMTNPCRADVMAKEVARNGLCNKQDDTDHGGSGFREVEGIPYENCLRLCAADDGCEGFAHDQRPGTAGFNKCYLKNPWPEGFSQINDVVSTQMTGNCRTEVQEHSPCLREMSTEYMTAGGGEVLHHVENTDYAGCSLTCAHDSSCVGFVASNTASECWLMKSFGSATTNNDRVSLRMTSADGSEACRVSIRDAWKLALYRNAAAADVSASIAGVQHLLSPPHASDAELGKLAFRLAVTKLTTLVSKLAP